MRADECVTCGYPYIVHIEAHAEWCEDIKQVNRSLSSYGSDTHCVRGHPRTPENTYVHPGWPPSTRCRLCRNLLAKKGATVTPTRLMGPRVRDVVKVVAEVTGFDFDELSGDSRIRELTDARHIAAWVAYHLGYAATYTLVGYVLNRDHSTIMTAIHRVDRTPALLEMAELISHDVAERFHRSQQGTLEVES